MEFACRGRPAADQDGGDSRRRFPDPPPPHGDAMLVIRDALLLQLQKDRLRQEIIMTELATLERAMALSSAARHGIDAAYVEQPKPLFLSSEEFMPHHRWMEQFSVVNEVHDLKKNDVKHGNVQLKSVNPAAEDRFSVCLRPCCSNSKAEENEAFDEQKLQESNEPTKMSPSLKWELTGITIPVKKPKQPQSWSCVICQVETPDTEHNIKEHCAGKKHRSNVASLESRNKTIIQKAETTAESSSCAAQKTSSIIWSCSTCQANGTSEADLKEHLSGKTHQQNIEGQCQEGDGMTKNAEPQEAMCQESKLPQLSEKPPYHCNGEEHLEKQKLLNFCEVCNLQCNSRKMLDHHRTGKKHQKNLDANK
uniref:C2H2-type domain-containing protein n=1 Tax=Setaria italica TaxID=4555 RepID=K3ZUH7_SETIT